MGRRAPKNGWLASVLTAWLFSLLVAAAIAEQSNVTTALDL